MGWLGSLGKAGLTIGGGLAGSLLGPAGTTWGAMLGSGLGGAAAGAWNEADQKAAQEAKSKQQADLRAAEIESSPWTGNTNFTAMDFTRPETGQAIQGAVGGVQQAMANQQNEAQQNMWQKLMDSEVNKNNMAALYSGSNSAAPAPAAPAPAAPTLMSSNMYTQPKFGSFGNK